MLTSYFDFDIMSNLIYKKSFIDIIWNNYWTLILSIFKYDTIPYRIINNLF